MPALPASVKLERPVPLVGSESRPPRNERRLAPLRQIESFEQFLPKGFVAVSQRQDDPIPCFPLNFRNPRQRGSLPPGVAILERVPELWSGRDDVSRRDAFVQM